MINIKDIENLRITAMTIQHSLEKVVKKYDKIEAKICLVDEIKELIATTSKTRFALESVITECQTVRGQTGVDVDEKKLIKIIKKEVEKYSEMPNREKEVELLKGLLPKEKPKLTEGEIKDFLSKETFEKPVDAMKYLDKLGYEGRYDKKFVATFILSKDKK